MKLHKKNKKKNKISLILFVIFLGLIFSLLIICFFSKNVSPILLSYSQAETKRLTTLVINKAVTKQMTEENLKMEDLFDVVMSSDGEIKLINFNSITVTKFLNATTNLVQLNLKLLEEGNVDLLELPENSYDEENLKNGIIYEVPIGMITKISLLSNIGPRIPVKLSLIGDVISNIETEVKEYGINNAMIEVGVYIEVTTLINLPFISKETTVSNTIPIAMKVIQGKIPNFYSKGFKTNSNIIETPIN